MAVVVEVGDREGQPRQVRVAVCVQVCADIGIDGGAEATRTVARQHTDGSPGVLNLVDQVERGHIEMAVAIEVARHHLIGARADGEARGGTEAGRDAVFQAYEAWPMRRGSWRAPPCAIAPAPARYEGGSQVLQPTVE